ncbi:MAG: peptidylprolyl isomerase [Caldithrix sp.]|nr:peptidylprolyl isomerase [Caldithrix sp.]
MKKSQIRLNPEEFQQIYDNATHYSVRQDLKKLFPELAENADLPPIRFNLTPSLQPDSIDFNRSPSLVELKTTQGSITIRLLPGIAPLTVHNFLNLVNKKFYDGLTFHRVIADFVIQGGDPSGTGWGGLPFFIPNENSFEPFKRGSVGIATSGMDTGSCQFFICQSEQFHLTGDYTLFGQVTKGMQTVDRVLPGDKIIEAKVISGPLSGNGS